MTNDEFQKRWATVRPNLEELVEAYVAVDGWKPDHGARLTHRREMLSHAIQILTDAGLECIENEVMATTMLPFPEVGEVVEWIYYRAYHKAGLAPGGQPGEEVSFKVNYMPTVRINAPEWFKRVDFMEWLCADTTATWHQKLLVNVTARGRVTVEKNMKADDYGDVFFTWGDGSNGSDFPGSKDRPGIPIDIWEFICDRMWEYLGTDQEALIWISNLE